MSGNSFPDYQPKRFAVQYSPPMIILEYLVPSTGKLYHHKMRLQRLTASSDPVHFLDYLKGRHSVYLGHTKITDEQLTGLIRRIQENMNPDLAKLDLNKLTTEEVQQYKSKMDVMFNKNQINPGDEGYEYDKRVDFEPNADCPWDESDDEVF